MVTGLTSQAGRYVRTLRHLRPAQWLGRLWNLRPQRIDMRIEPFELRRPDRAAVFVDWREAQIRGDHYVNQNLSAALDAPDFWAGVGKPRLWQYQLHYHDFLNCRPAPTAVQAQALLATWLTAQPPGARPGWEPYPLSRRLLNWAKWLGRGGTLPAPLARALVVQSRALRARLEYHLMGNHLLANGIALAAVGIVLDGAEGSRAARRGAGLILGQLPEQTLADGCNFELSPMYHLILLEDLLDLLELDAAFGGRLAPAVRDLIHDVAGRMSAFLPRISHDDETFGLFNDAAAGECAAPGRLWRQAVRQRVVDGPFDPPADTLPQLEFTRASGFGRARGAGWTLLLDAGAIGPDYIPGHAHCDMLSFELSDAAGVLITDTGTSTYEVCPRRQHERGTAAHNTVAVDGLEQSEVWGGFRVGRRARILQARHDQTWLQAAHDGFRSRRLVHERRFDFGADSIRIEDGLAGGEGTARLHLRPGLTCEVAGTAVQVLDAGRRRLTIEFESTTLVAAPAIEAYEFAAGFNRLESGWCLTVTFRDRLVTHLRPAAAPTPTRTEETMA